MRRLKTDVAIIGSGTLAIFIAQALLAKPLREVLINPLKEFDCSDIRPHAGLGLWNAIYRSQQSQQSQFGSTLSGYEHELERRLRDLFPAPVQNSGLRRLDQWTLLSGTPIHKAHTDDFEKEYFRLEKKNWASGHVRLINPDHALTILRKQGLEVQRVAQLEGAFVRNYALWWDAPKILSFLLHFLKNRFSQAGAERLLSHKHDAFLFKGVKIRGRYGRRVVIEGSDFEEVSVEPESNLMICLTGDLLPTMRSVVAACDEPWIQGVRKRRREQHFAWFNSPTLTCDSNAFWIEIGGTKYLCGKGGADLRESGSAAYATWTSERGPDALDSVVDEGFRILDSGSRKPRFVRSERTFRLEWDWKNPQWRTTAHDTQWATAFEGDLWSTLELAWNVPLS